jgi:hypothetical protein
MIGRFALTLLGPPNRVFMRVGLRRLARLAEAQSRFAA